jgi:hypothetical protein
MLLFIMLRVESSLRPTVSRPVSLGIKHPSGTYDQMFITFWQLQSYFCIAPNLTRGRVCLLYMLLALASAIFLGSKSLGTRHHTLLSQVRDFPFRRLLWLTGLQWRYSTPPPYGKSCFSFNDSRFILARTEYRALNSTVRVFVCYNPPIRCHGNAWSRCYANPNPIVLQWTSIIVDSVTLGNVFS